MDTYRNAAKRLLLFDYDGTLVQFQSVPELAVLNMESKSLLTKFSNDGANDLKIITGRTYWSIDHLLGNLPIDIIADHGGMRRVNQHWYQSAEPANSWKPEIQCIMQSWHSKYYGSFIEDKSFSLAWHYRNCDVILNQDLLAPLQEEIEPMLNMFHLRLLVGNMVLEVLPNDIGKGISVEGILEECEYDFILAVGDDASDEEMFSTLLPFPNAFTYKVGCGESLAKGRLAGVEDVHQLLMTIAK